MTVNRNFSTALSEYYIAGCLMKHWPEWNNSSLKVQTFIMKDIFLNEDFEVTGILVDGLLSRTNQSV